MNEKSFNEEEKLHMVLSFNDLNNIPVIEKNQKLITCTKMNKYFLFPFISAFVITVRYIMMNNIIYYNDDINFHLVHMINMDCFMFLGGLIYFIIDLPQYKENQITKIIMKNKEKINNYNNDVGFTDDKNINKIQKKKRM